MDMHLVEIVQKVKFANSSLFRPEVHFNFKKKEKKNQGIMERIFFPSHSNPSRKEVFHEMCCS